MLHSRWAGHLICDLSRIIATWCSYCSVNPLLPQNCIYLQSDLSCLYKLICHLFNHLERLLGIGHQQSAIFTRGQFWPSGIVVACVCLCVRPSVRVCGNHLLVRAITRHPFKLGSPNLDHRCKRPWLRSLLFWGVIDLDLQGQINFKVKSYPILSFSAR